MPKLTIGPLGSSGGPGGPGGSPGKRGVVQGWSVGSARRNEKFLRSIDVKQLPPAGLAFTLTLALLPTEAEWRRLLDLLKKHLRTNGAHCWHIVVEWTARGVPHLHGVAFYQQPKASEGLDILSCWLRWTRHLGTSERGQNIVEIFSLQGWAEYASKHMARGAHNYQREADAVPHSWEKTGRMWFKGGDWPVSETSVELSDAQFWWVRRHVDKWLRASFRTKARTTTGWRHDYWLRCEVWQRNRRVRLIEPIQSRSRGISAFIPGELMERLVSAARDACPDRLNVYAQRSENHATFFIGALRVHVVNPAGLRSGGEPGVDGYCEASDRWDGDPSGAGD
jgi:hypothetical protein